MLKLTQAPYFGPWWEIIFDIRIHAELVTGPTNPDFLLTIGILKTPAFQTTLIWGGRSTTYLNLCILWCLMLVTGSEA